MKIVIMAIPERARFVEEMLRRLPHASVREDKEHRGALIMFESIMRDYAASEGVAVLQDDTIVAPWFSDELSAAVDPNQHTSFFHRSPKQVSLYEAGVSYATIRKPWGLANYFPSEFIREYLRWAKSGPVIDPMGSKRVEGHRYAGVDDGSVWMFMRDTGRKAHLTIPNLVNHRNEKSSQGHSRSFKVEHAWVSSLFGKQYLRPWRREAIGNLPTL